MADSAALFSSANELCTIHRCGEAVGLWEHASSLCPADPDIHYQLGFCYAGGCGVRGLLDSEIAVYHYRRALSLASRQNTLARAMILGALGNAYLASARPAMPHLLNAIHCYEEAAGTYAKARRLDDWAREQYNLGNAWCEMPEAQFPAKWQKAVEHFERALSVRTRRRDAKQHAATLQNLGTAYRELKSGDRSRNIRKAIECYHQALRALRDPTPGKKRADLHHNLGNAYLTLAGAEENGRRNIPRAIRHFARALTMRTKAETPFEYAATQYSRGQAFFRLAMGGIGGASSLDQARVCFVEAMDAFVLAGEIEFADTVRKNLNSVVPRDVQESRRPQLTSAS
jgi:tetratricopeptide (TPR) repeat protein